MARYRMDDGTVVDTDKATQSWPAKTKWDGNNNISVHGDGCWGSQNLYRSRRGRYYIEHLRFDLESRDWCEWISPQQAVQWLTINDDPIPDELAAYVEDAVE